MHSLVGLLGSLLLALQTLHLGSPLSTSLALPPRKPSVSAVVGFSRNTGLLSSTSNNPVGLTVHVAGTQLRARLGINSLHISHASAVLIDRGHQVRLVGNWLDAWNGGHVQPTPTRCIAWVREPALLLENNANVSSLGVPFGVQIIPNIAGLRGVDCVIAPHAAVIAGEPFRSSLFENNTSGNDVFAAGTLRTESLAGRIA